MNETGERRPEDAEARRRRDISALVARWCHESVLAAEPIDLTDTAALHIAAGRAGADIAQVVLVRVRAGLPTPQLDAAGLRRAADRVRAHDTAVRRRADGGRGRWQPLAEEQRRRLRTRRGQVLELLRAYPTGLRRTRRELRDGVLLTLEQRTQLFDMLCWTPAPEVHGMGAIGAAGLNAVTGIAEATAGRLPTTSAARSVADRLGRWGRREQQALPELRFRDGYDTLLYLAGRYRDRIEADPVWHSPMFDLQRAGVDFARELVDLAADATELHRITARLTAATGSADPLVRESVTPRLEALDGVWAQLVERVAALVAIDDALASVGAALQTVRDLHRTRRFDDRIDDLVARSGAAGAAAEMNHWISAEIQAGGIGYARYQQAVAREIEQLGRGRA